MKDATKRSILRWIHIVFGIPIIGYVYSPFAELPNYALWFGMSPFRNCPVGIVDVERPCLSTTYFEKIGLTERAIKPKPLWGHNGAQAYYAARAFRGSLRA